VIITIFKSVISVKVWVHDNWISLLQCVLGGKNLELADEAGAALHEAQQDLELRGLSGFS
jgi:hypothetical protein